MTVIRRGVRAERLRIARCAGAFQEGGRGVGALVAERSGRRYSLGDRMLVRIENGEGRQEDLDMLVDVANNIEGRTICALGDAAAWPVQSFLKHFRDEFQYHIDNGKFPPGVTPSRVAA